MNKNIYTIYKPKGPTSFDIVAQVKRATGESRVGHAGTLDPLASGVLVIGVGREATRQLAEIVQKEKEYIADVKLGMTSTTDDEEGQKSIKPVSSKVHKAEIKKVIKNFIGTIDQVPPIYSAIKVSGQRAYKAARKGQDLNLQSRPVEIKKITILKYRYPDLKLKVVTGKGVYIRALARDIGAGLGVGGYLTNLERTRVGQFKKNNSMTIDKIKKEYFDRLVTILKQGGIGVIPTDTIYGLVGLALSEKTVERIYTVRQRRPDKPLIILISSISELKKFGVKLDLKTKTILNKYWPRAVSIILPCAKKLAYLHRGTDTLAFRLPDDKEVIALLKKTGPLVAPSANPEGKDPALTIKQAKRYFSDQVDFYFDSGKKVSEPSTLISVVDGEVKVLREGKVEVKL